MLGTRRALYWQLAGFAIAIGLIWLLSRFFPVVEFVSILQQRISVLGPWSVACYPALFALCNVLLLPGGILCIGAGFFFGLWWGFFIVLVGNSIAAAISFVLSRWLGQRWLTEKLSRNPMLAVLESGVEREAWKIIFLSQLH